MVAIWLAMAMTVDSAYWATLLLSVPAAALLVRLFMIQHDCGHRSFFRSARLNELVGHAIGVLTLTPHGYWRRAHNIHHATSRSEEHTSELQSLMRNSYAVFRLKKKKKTTIKHNK